MQAELLANRRQWENRLLAQTASRWGLSPFALVLRVYQGFGGLLSGALLYRARTPAQMALWGALEGVHAWRKRQQQQTGRARRRPGRRRRLGRRRAAQGRDDRRRLRRRGRAGPRAAQCDTRWPPRPKRPPGTSSPACPAELESLIARLAQRHTGWFTRWRYELLLAAMLGLLLYRLGKNFFYDSWLAEPPSPVFGLEFYVSAGFWLVLVVPAVAVGVLQPIARRPARRDQSPGRRLARCLGGRRTFCRARNPLPPH